MARTEANPCFLTARLFRYRKYLVDALEFDEDDAKNAKVPFFNVSFLLR